MKDNLRIYLCNGLYFVAGHLIGLGERVMKLADKQFNQLVPPPQSNQGKLFD